MLSGRPIVATALPTHTQVLDDTTAVLTSVTPADLAVGLIRALDDPDQAANLAAAALERVNRDYNYDQFKSKLARVYQIATGSNG